jgi:electron transport protein HydN
MACPYGAMEIVAREANIQNNRRLPDGSLAVEAFKCDLCIHVPKGPACLEVCPTKAIYTIDAKVLEDNLRRKREQAAVAQM